MSHSENKPKTSQTSSTSVTNLNVQDTEGVTIVGDGNAVTTTDFGAITTAGELGFAALDLGRRSVDNVVDFAGRGVDAVIGATRDVNRDSLDFAGQALDTVAQFAESGNRGVLDFAGETLDSAFGFATDAGDQVLEFARDLVGGTVSGLKDLSMQTSASTDDRVAKVAMYAFAAVAALVVLPQLFKKAA